jgi:hypothetical protein
VQGLLLYGDHNHRFRPEAVGRSHGVDSSRAVAGRAVRFGPRWVLSAYLQELNVNDVMRVLQLNLPLLT